MILAGEGWVRFGRSAKECRRTNRYNAFFEAKDFAVGGLQHDDITAVALKIPRR